MGFLYLEDDRVKITIEGKALKEAKALNASDRHKGKPFYNKVLIYTYYAYTFDGVFKEFLPDSRKKEVAERYCGRTSWLDIENNKHAKEFISVYNKTSKTFVQRSYENIKADMQDLMEYLRSIPFRTTGGDDNSEEKLKAIKSYEILLGLEERIRNKVTEEKTKGRKRSTKRFLDTEAKK